MRRREKTRRTDRADELIVPVFVLVQVVFESIQKVTTLVNAALNVVNVEPEAVV